MESREDLLIEDARTAADEQTLPEGWKLVEVETGPNIVFRKDAPEKILRIDEAAKTITIPAEVTEGHDQLDVEFTFERDRVVGGIVSLRVTRVKRGGKATFAPPILSIKAWRVIKL